MIDFPDMVPLVCPTCRTESPEGSRFCSMCGQPLAGSSSVRASAPDRRVQTSPVGTVLPIEVLTALSAATAGGQRSSSWREAAGTSRTAVVADGHRADETARIEREPRVASKSSRSVPRRVADEATLPVRYRQTRKGRAARLVRSFLFGVLWFLLAGLVAMLVVWILPERPTMSSSLGLGVSPAQQRETTAKRSGPATFGTKSARLAYRPSPPSPPSPPNPSSPSTPSPSGAPVGPAARAPLVTATGEAPVESQRTPTAAAADATAATAATLSGAARAAWQQDVANIEFVATTYAAQIRSCYERAISGLAGDAPRGRVVVLFTLTDGGTAQGPAISEDSLGLPILANCLTRRVAEWRFPRPVGPMRTFRLPFEFAGTKR